MALTAYSSIKPTVKSLVCMGGARSASSTSQVVNAPGSWDPGDYCVAIFTTSGAADPTSVVSNGINFTKAFGANGISIWYALNNTTNSFGYPAITATYAVATTATPNAFIVQKASGITVGAGASAVAQTVGVVFSPMGSVAMGSQHGLVISLVGFRRTSGSVDFQIAYDNVVPASLGAAWAGISEALSAPAMGYFIAASQSEDLDPAATAALPIADMSAGATFLYAGVMLYFAPSTISLDDLTYQLGDDGPLLNQSGVAVPFYDVESIDGLSDMDITNSSDAIDGTDGSYVEGRFISGKTLVIGGTIYGGSPFPESLIDALKTATLPAKSGKYFYFKLPGKNPRRVMAYPIGLKVPHDRSRTLAAVPYQIQALTQDAFYIELDAAVRSDAFATQINLGITPSGNREAFPTIYLSVVGGQQVSLANYTHAAKYGKLIPFSTTQGLRFTTPTVLGSLRAVLKLDLKARTLWLLDPLNTRNTSLGYSVYNTSWIDTSSSLTLRGWWTLIQGVNNGILYVFPVGATGFVTTVYRNSWS